MQNQHSPHTTLQSSSLRTLGRVLLTAAIVLPGLALAQSGGDAIGTTCGFLGSFLKLLNAASIVVVTIAVIFAGYQVAFAHKRISDVAPTLIGAILIGAASQIAKMILTNSAGSDACQTTSIPASNMFATAMQFLAQYA